MTLKPIKIEGKLNVESFSCEIRSSWSEIVDFIAVESTTLSRDRLDLDVCKNRVNTFRADDWHTYIYYITVYIKMIVDDTQEFQIYEVINNYVIG